MAKRLKGIGKVLGSVAKGTSKSIDTIAKPMRATGDVLGNVAFSAGKVGVNQVKKNTFRPDKRGRTASNLYTGRKLSNRATLGIGAAGAAVGAYSVGSSEIKASAPRRVGTVEVGAAPMMEADGTSNLSNLNATGDMVFGMHNSRKG